MKKKKYLAIFMAMSMATATAPVTALADGADTTGTESGTGAGESGSGETGSETGGTEGGSATAPEESKIDSFDKLKAAIEAAEAGETVTITLEADITVPENEIVVVNAGKNITLDLGGNTLEGSVRLFNGRLTVKNGTIENKEGQAINVICSRDANDTEYSVLTVAKDAIIQASEGYGIIIREYGGTTLGYGTVVNVEGTVNGVIWVMGNLGNAETSASAMKESRNAPVINVKSSAVVNGYDSPGIAQMGYITVNVEDGASITGCEAIGMKRGVLNINGGEFVATGEAKDPVDANNNGSEDSGAAISVSSNYNYAGGIEVNIADGTFKSKNQAAVYVGHSAKDGVNKTFETGVTLNISGGSFSGNKTYGAVLIADRINGDADSYTKKVISGGVFDSNVQEYAADGYKAIQVTDDKYVVTDKIALDKTSTRIRRGYTDTLKAIVEANGKTYDVADPIAWASDKKSVATVKDGVVTGVDYGTATITATLGATTGTPATQAEGDEVTGGDAVTDGDNTPSNTLTASCTVTVFKKSSSGSSSGGGGGSSAAKHGVTISDSKNGAVTASTAKAETGDKVILTPKADEGYELDKITAKDKDGKEVKLKAEKDGTYSFTMPKGGVTVDTTFKQAEGATNTDKPAAAAKTIILQIGSTAVLVDDQAIINDVAPVIRNDRTLVPIRVITEALGGQVAWNEAAKEVTLTVNGKEIKMTIGKVLEKYGVAPVIIGGRTFVPVRFVADELGAVTTWDDATKTVTIQAVK